jgi:peptidyl-prolyl cis-trans isomerase A (cyclophilin A)
MSLRPHLPGLLVCAALLPAAILSPSAVRADSIVRFNTVMGSFDIQLLDDTMPRTVLNFLNYVSSGRYSGTVVHRNSDSYDSSLGAYRDFVIQGGGYSLHDPVSPQTVITYSSVTTDPAIADEPGGGIAGPSNLRGTIAMAKSGPNTVTSQWFINQGDNSSLDSPSRSDGGFSAFGMVLGNGMSVVDAIGDLPLPTDFGFSIGSPFNDLPLRNFSGTSISQIRVANTVTVNSVTLMTFAAGDFDRNNLVNAADRAILLANYGLTQGAYFDDGDADMDGDVDGHDFLLWQRTFGQTSLTAAISTVPEPASLTLAVFACGLLLRRSSASDRR